MPRGPACVERAAKGEWIADAEPQPQSAVNAVFGRLERGAGSIARDHCPGAGDPMA